MTEPEQPRNPISMKFGDLKKFIDDRFRELSGGGNEPAPRQSPLRQGQGQPPRQRSVDDEVSAALKKIEADKAREQRDTNTDKRLSDLEERTKEKPPVERRRVHRLMGWGE